MIFVFAGGLILGSGAVGLVWLVVQMIERARHDEQARRELATRIERMENGGAARLPYKTADAIEDATAALLSLKFDTDMRQQKIENALAHLQKARDPGGKTSRKE